MMLVCPDERNQHAEWRAHLGSAAQRRIEHDLSKIGSNIATSHKRATRPTASTPLRKIILFNEYIGDVRLQRINSRLKKAVWTQWTEGIANDDAFLRGVPRGNCDGVACTRSGILSDVEPLVAGARN